MDEKEDRPEAGPEGEGDPKEEPDTKEEPGAKEKPGTKEERGPEEPAEAETPVEAVVEGETPAEAIAEAETPAEAVVEGETPAEAIAEAETPAEAVAEGETPAEAAAEAETPVEAVAEAETPAEPPRRGLRHYVLTVAVSATVVLFALVLFAAGFWTQSLLDEDVDLDPVTEELAVLTERVGEIQDSLRGAGGDGGGDTGDGGTSPSAATSTAADDDPSWGPDDAAVVVVEFADFQCPFCARHSTQTLPQIKAAYGDKVRYIYRDFPLTSIHQFAQKAAEAGQCAQEQGQFWEYHDLLFANQNALAVADLKGYAEQVGADTEEFNDCLDSGKHQAEVLRDLQDGTTAGITGTPGFIINNLVVSGAQPFEQFQAVIDQALAAEE